MINNSDFTKRLQKIMEKYHLSSSQFADKIGVPRSSISHILSGRNKPSLDFVLKITHTFQDVDMYWLVNGKGSFPSMQSNKPNESSKDSISSTNIKKVKRIVVFYEDGTFEEFIK